MYEPLWRPDENGISQAKQLIEPLQTGLDLLKSDPNRFCQYNPVNGWGDYYGLVGFITEYLAACRQYPEAKVAVWR